jgi:hypothetical protein
VQFPPAARLTRSTAKQKSYFNLFSAVVAAQTIGRAHENNFALMKKRYLGIHHSNFANKNGHFTHHWRHGDVIFKPMWLCQCGSIVVVV